MGELIDLSGAIFAAGIVFWLAGGAEWVKEQVRSKALLNDEKEIELEERRNKLTVGQGE